MSADAVAVSDPDRWYPVGRSDDAPPRHVHQAKLAGRELAVWRADDGYLNVWENRCLHRGVRLTMGFNEGMELRCLYHGWRYANRTAGCTYIPAHPADAPAQTICNRLFPSVERYGLMWTTERGTGEPTPIPALETGMPFPLRSLPFVAAPALVANHLAGYCFRPSYAVSDAPVAGPEPTISSERLGESAAQITSTTGDHRETVVFLVQPVDSGECVVHSVLTDDPGASCHLAVWRHHAYQLTLLRDHVEAIAATLPRPEPIQPALERIEPSEIGPPTPRARADAELRVVVHCKWIVGEGIAAFELASIAGPLPAAPPGSHIDVHLPNGLVRQYSLVNRSGDHERYVIGVKREPESAGGSQCLHETVREGDVLAISAPRNNFRLRRDADRTILVAGGIGVTPLLAMAATLHAERHSFQLHYFAQSEAHVAFRERLDALGAGLVTHLGLGPSETGDALTAILADYRPVSHVYVCGPGPMLDAARAMAADAGWPEYAVHFEYFKNTGSIDQSREFTISLARSGLTLPVHSGETILDVLRANGVTMPSSCEQGACGTCIVGVVRGRPLHQDVYLKPSEREAGDRIATCVSRSMSDELVLDV